DIFMVHGLSEYEELKDYIEPQNGAAWEQNVAAFAKSAYTATDGVVMGMPVVAEYFGLLYNKDIFAKAGITNLPTNFAEFEEVVAKVKAIGVAPFATGWATGWVCGQHVMNNVISKRADIQAYVAGLNNGTKKLTDDAQVLGYGDVIDLILANTYANPLQEDHAASVTNFATGQAAMLTQGNWKENSIRTINPDINIGIMGLPTGKDDKNGNSIMSGLPFLLAINSQIPEARKQACKDFLLWFVTDPTAQKYIVEKFAGVPAYTNFDTTNLSPLAKECVAYDAAGNSFAWSFSQWPSNIPQGEFAIDMQGYIGGQYASWADCVAQMQKDWSNSI
ncbi:MAG: extracellular solute-binding protein, partial [Spirochaetales bacterium]|nr:extracellular solute-binding protein [Spirochaetales bacterium]